MASQVKSVLSEVIPSTSKTIPRMSRIPEAFRLLAVIEQPVCKEFSPEIVMGSHRKDMQVLDVAKGNAGKRIYRYCLTYAGIGIGTVPMLDDLVFPSR